ncbi:MAG TPA: GNAT family protein [Candidatus Dormibacteraeota bacterium]|nr:GNAT family protein [Candidatus Dormibacteraeota bacterium]
MPVLTVREMRLDEVGIRIEYFHGSSDDHLRRLGVDRALLPTRPKWRAFYEEDATRPIQDRVNYSLLWESDGRVVGFSTVDRIVFGREAFLHLHILRADQRHAGLGTPLVVKSASVYFEVLQLERIFSEPNAFNVAPNRTLQRAGFRYLFTHTAQPSPVNFPQVTTRWVLERPG